MHPTSLEDLLAIQAIGQLKAKYCRFVDTKQWDRLATLFAPGAKLDGFGSAPDGSDAVAFVAGIGKRLANVVSVHHCHTPEIRLEGPDRARGIWAMMDYLDFGEGQGPAEAPGSRGFVGYGYYEEEYRRIGGVWLLAYMRLTRQRIDPLPANHPRPLPGRYAPTPDWL